MSNLYKYRFITKEEDNTRVINSNELIAEKLQELNKKMIQQDGDFIEGFNEHLDEAMVEELVEEPIQVELRQKAEEEAARIIAEAEMKAKQMLEQAEASKQELYQKAREDGKKAGYEEGKAKVDTEYLEMKTQMQDLENRLHADYHNKLNQMEAQLVGVVAKVFEKVFHIQFGDKTQILLSLVSDAIMDIEGSKHFRIRVSQVNYEFMESHKKEIENRVGEDISLEMIADSMLEENQCTIETESGLFDCSLGVQLENLIKDLKSLSIS